LLRKGLDKRTGEVGGTLEERSEAEFKRMLDPNTDTGRMVGELVKEIVDTASRLTHSDPLAKVISDLGGVPVQLFKFITGRPELDYPNREGARDPRSAIFEDGRPAFKLSGGKVSDGQSLLLLGEMGNKKIGFHYRTPDPAAELSAAIRGRYTTLNNVDPLNHRVSPQSVYEHLLSAADAMEKTQRRLAFT